jgi:hypothetical protein
MDLRLFWFGAIEIDVGVDGLGQFNSVCDLLRLISSTKKTYIDERAIAIQRDAVPGSLVDRSKWQQQQVGVQYRDCFGRPVVFDPVPVGSPFGRKPRKRCDWSDW